MEENKEEDKLEWYLVTQIKWFFDGLGGSDEGKTLKFITNRKEYLEYKKDTFYRQGSDLLDIESEKQDRISKNGCNCIRYKYEVKKIESEEERERISKILTDYGKL